MKSLRAYLSRIRAKVSKLGDDPETDWRLALATFAVALVVIVALDAYLASDVIKSPEADASDEVGGVTLDRKALSETAAALSRMPAPLSETTLSDPSL